VEIEANALIAVPIEIGDEKHTRLISLIDLLNENRLLRSRVVKLEKRFETYLAARYASPKLEKGSRTGRRVADTDDDAGVPESREEDSVTGHDIDLVDKLFDPDATPASYGITVASDPSD
jgi:hypothetical protein